MTAERLARECAFYTADAPEDKLCAVEDAEEYRMDADVREGILEALRVGSCMVCDRFYSVIDDEDLVSGAIALLGRQERVFFRLRREILSSGRVLSVSSERVELLRFCLDCLTLDLNRRIVHWDRSRHDARRETVRQWLLDRAGVLPRLWDYVDKLEVCNGNSRPCN